MGSTITEKIVSRAVGRNVKRESSSMRYPWTSSTSTR